jgi:energy-coupling factor transport system ATP-binding protein
MDESVNAQPLIDIQQVVYSYPVPKVLKGEMLQAPALSDVNLQIWPGEYVVLLGHNGSGKSTLARHCNALLLPDAGRVLVAGFDTRDSEKQRVIRDNVGMIFQNPDNQIIATVVEDDVAWGLAVRGLPVGQIRMRVTEAMEAVGIAHLRQLPPQQLSGGQRQRLAIAGILALRPRCIIADEATSMLDPFSRQEITRLLSQLHLDYGLTIIQVTHLLEETTFAQRIVVMEQGHITLECTPGELFSDLARLQALKLVIPDPIVLAERLRVAGFPIAQDALTNEVIAKEITR